jgi:hypothetical protein
VTNDTERSQKQAGSWRDTLIIRGTGTREAMAFAFFDTFGGYTNGERPRDLAPAVLLDFDTKGKPVARYIYSLARPCASAKHT